MEGLSLIPVLRVLAVLWTRFLFLDEVNLSSSSKCTNFEIVIHRKVFCCWRLPKWRFVSIIFKINVTKNWSLLVELTLNSILLLRNTWRRVIISLFSELLRWSSLKIVRFPCVFFVKLTDFYTVKYVTSSFRGETRNNLNWLRK